MQRQRQVQRGRRRLAGMVVRRAADAAAGQHHIAGGEAASIGGRQRIAIIGQELRPAQLHATRGQQFDDFGEVFVLSAPRQDFVSDDDQANTAGGGFCGHVQFQV